MHWLGYALGLGVGTTFGFWLYGFWEELRAVGGSRPPQFDAIVPLGLLVLGAALLVAANRRRR